MPRSGRYRKAQCLAAPGLLRLNRVWPHRPQPVVNTAKTTGNRPRMAVRVRGYQRASGLLNAARRPFQMISPKNFVLQTEALRLKRHAGRKKVLDMAPAYLYIAYKLELVPGIIGP